MEINPDKVPVSLDDAIETLKESLLPGDIKEFKSPTFQPLHLHFGFGMMLRNEWSLRDKESRLVKWFHKKYGINHADDISSLILDGLYRDVLGKPRQTDTLVKHYLSKWKDQETP